MNCSTENCSKTGRWHPVLELRSRKNGPITEATYTQIVQCDDHKEAANLASFLSAEAFVKIAKHMREHGKTNPIQRNTTLTWSLISPKKTDLITVDLISDPTANEDLAF